MMPDHRPDRADAGSVGPCPRKRSAVLQIRGSAYPEFFLSLFLRFATAIPAEVSSMFADHAGTTGCFSFCRAARAFASSFRCAFTNSGGVNASH